MDRAFLAIIDRRGLRALLPEDDDGYRAAAEYSRFIRPAVCYWATLSTDAAADVLRQLSRFDFRGACQEVCNRAAHLGPVSAASPLTGEQLRF
jgi:hypothetical protein